MLLAKYFQNVLLLAKYLFNIFLLVNELNLSMQGQLSNIFTYNNKVEIFLKKL